MYVHGVSGETKVTCTMIQYSPKDKGLALAWTETEKLEFYYCIAKCCSGYNHPPKYLPAPILEPPLKTFTWWLHTPRFTPCDRVSLYIHLAYLFHSSICMLMSKSCLQPCSVYAQSLCFICVCCVCHEGICPTHIQSHIHCRASVVSIMNEQSWVSRSSLVPLVSHVEHVCLMAWSVRRQVMWVCVCMITYASFDCSHT